ncbi:MAG: YfhO family protein [bacterium]|nr:YfhO family protein [bacterium]
MKDIQGCRERGRKVFAITKKHVQNMNYYLLYTLVFMLMSTTIFSFFFLNGKSLVWHLDGLTQHMNALGYYGRWLREIVRTIIFEHKFEVPMWDLSIGYGADIITTLHYYAIGDPLDLLSILVPIRYSEYLYQFLIILRIYLAGLTFSVYARTHSNKRAATLIGTLVYCFCGYILIIGIRHPYFTNPMIYFPIILIGADRILAGKKPTIFIGMLGIACISNFYFAYMICLLTVIYVVVRYFSEIHKFQIKEALQMFFKFVFFALIGIAIAGIIMVPIVGFLMNTNRMAAANHIFLVYPLDYYLKFLGNFTTTNNAYSTFLGFSAISIIGVVTLFVKKNKNKELKIAFIIMTIMLMVPYLGHVMNGFSYVSNRWSWGYAMLVAYIVVKIVPELETLTVKEIGRIIGCLSLYFIVLIVSKYTRTERNMVSGIIVLCFAIFLLYTSVFEKTKKYMSVLCFSITVVSIFLNAKYNFSTQNGNYVNEFVEQGESYKKLTENLPSQMVKDQKDKGIVRYDQFGAAKMYNSAMQNNLYSTEFYFSLNNGYITQFFDEMYINIPIEQKYYDLDGRTILDTLASVKYFIIPKSKRSYLPYTFIGKQIDAVELEKVERTEKETGLELDSEGKSGVDQKSGKVTVKSDVYELYKTNNSLPIGYTYDTCISREEYEKMSVSDKQEALLQGVVLEKSSFPETSLVLTNKKIPYTVEMSGDITVEEGKFQVNDKDARVTLSFEGLENSETYVVFDELRYTAQNPLDLYNDALWDTMSVYKKRVLKNKYSDWSHLFNSTGEIVVASSNVRKTVTTFTPDYSFYSGKSNYLVNLGYNKGQIKKITLSFNQVGTYEFNDMSIVCQPMEKMNSYTKKLKQNKLKQVTLKNNSISGKITCDSNKILCMSIPYSKGWTAYVDGEKTEVKQANTMYMAVELGDGDHTVEFRYQTPKILVGCMVSMIGLIIYLGVIIFYRKKK